MKCLFVLCALAVAVYAVPQRKSLSERVESSFTKWLKTEKKEMIYPPGFNDKVCDSDCCTGNSCANGNCQDGASAGEDTLASKYGYVCEGSMCGSKPGQFSGVFCDVPAATACDECEKKHGKYEVCYASTATKFGYVCLKKQGDDYLALDRREFDVLYGEGTSAQLERIAKEEDAAEVPDKKSLSELIRALVAELDDEEQ